jgi:hypothetical protein
MKAARGRARKRLRFCRDDIARFGAGNRVNENGGVAPAFRAWAR